MKKKIGLVVMIALLCAGLAGCGKPAVQAAKPCADIVAAVEAGQAFEELVSQSRKQLVSFIGLDDESLTDAAMSIDASRATSEMIVVLTAKDSDALKAAQARLTAFRDETLAEYRDYAPQEAPKLEGAVLTARNLQTALIVSKDAAAAQRALDAAWK